MTTQEKEQYATPFLKDLGSGRTIKFNGKDMPMAIYNLIVSKRDLGLWKMGMKPHRGWKVTDVKKYFGFTGHDKAGLVKQADDLYNLCFETFAKQLIKFWFS